MAFKFKKPSPYKIFGSGKRKKEQEAAKGAFDQQMRAYEGMDVGQNFYAGFENPYEDLTVDTTAQQLAANQYAQSMANISGAIDPSNVGAVLRQAGQQALQTRASTASTRNGKSKNGCSRCYSATTNGYGWRRSCFW